MKNDLENVSRNKKVKIRISFTWVTPLCYYKLDDGKL